MSDLPTFPPPPPPVQTKAFSKLNTSLWILFLISGILGIAEVIAMAIRTGVYVQLEEEITSEKVDFATSVEDTVANLSLLGLLLGIAIFVILIVYTFKLVKKTRSAGNKIRMSNGMAIGGWFIPLANAVIVFLFFVDIVRADASRRARGIMLLNLWWWPYLVGYAFYSGAESGLSEAEDFQELATYSGLSVLGGVVVLISFVFAILFFRHIRHFEASLDARSSA